MKRYLALMALVLCAACFTGCNSNDNSDEETVKTVTKEDGKTYTVYTFTPATTYQTVDGIGAGFTYYTGWVNYQSSSVQSAEFDTLFSDAKIPILRFMCKYEYTTDNVDAELATMQKFYTAAKSRLPSGESPIVLMCCWSPKASLKSNGNTAAKKDSSGNAISSSADYGTLIKDNDGNYEYDAYAAWWAEAVKYYETNGIPISYVSIQNEVDWPTTYESCLFSATESGGYASYAKAFVAVYNAFQSASLTKVPSLLGPETLTAASSNIKSYTDAILAETNGSAALKGIAHHLYGGGTSKEDISTNFKNESICTPSTYDTNLGALYTKYSNLKRWQTEFFRGHAIQTASMINHCMTVEQAHAYIYWDGVWYTEADSDHFERDGLVCIENNSSNFNTWVKHASYYALRHFSEFIRPGYVRIGSGTPVSGIESSAYMKSDGTKVAVVLINTTSSAAYYTITGSGYTMTANKVYQSTFGETCTSADTCWQTATMDSGYYVTLPAYSVTTIDITGTK
jgi:O-glycosyl hydrolase